MDPWRCTISNVVTKSKSLVEKGLEKIETIQLKSNQPLREDFIHDYDKTQSWFSYNPQKHADWERRVKEMKQEQALAVDRNKLVKALIDFNRKMNNSAQALEHIELLAREDAVVVVGGQQAGLFGGPLLVLYKAITILQAARDASESLQIPVIPVFWIAGEDHDFEEANHMYFLSQDTTISKIKLTHPTGRRTSVSQTRIPKDSWLQAIDELSASLPDSEYKHALLQLAMNLHQDASSLVESSGKLLASLFGSYGLVLMDSDDPAIRHLESPMFRKLIEDNAAINNTILESAKDMKDSGYPVQVDLNDHAANLFVYDELGERTLLYRTEIHYADRRGSYQLSREQLLEYADNCPERLSNNVMSRPLMQQYLLPVLATVLGPAEIAYWALTGRAFEQFGWKMPMILSRSEFTLMDSAVQRNMEKYELTWDDVQLHFQERRRGWLEDQDDLNLAQKFADARKQFDAIYGPILDAAGKLNQGMAELAEKNRQRILKEMLYLERRTVESNKIRYETGLKQLDRVAFSLFPMEKPQERVYNGFAYLNKYGRKWLDDLVAMPLRTDGLHTIYHIG